MKGRCSGCGFEATGAVVVLLVSFDQRNGWSAELAGVFAEGVDLAFLGREMRVIGFLQPAFIIDADELLAFLPERGDRLEGGEGGLRDEFHGK